MHYNEITELIYTHCRIYAGHSHEELLVHRFAKYSYFHWYSCLNLKAYLFQEYLNFW